MATYESRFITPPTEEEEIYPYRRVWPSLIAESAVFFGVVLVVFAATRFIQVPPLLHLPLGIFFALLPAGLWLILSWWRERLVPQPREKLILVAVISALAANAIGIPLVNDIFQIDRWLSLQSAINRIIGYTFTVGITQAMIAYLILRYTVWSTDFRTRLDAIAYGAANAVGYATVVNLSYILSATPAPDVAAMGVFNTFILSLIAGLIVGYGLSEVRFSSQPYVLLLSGTVALASLVIGAVIPLRTGLINAGISAASTVSIVSPIRGFLFSGVVLAAVSVGIAFLLNIAERRDAEAAADEDAA